MKFIVAFLSLAASFLAMIGAPAFAGDQSCGGLGAGTATAVGGSRLHIQVYTKSPGEFVPELVVWTAVPAEPALPDFTVSARFNSHDLVFGAATELSVKVPADLEPKSDLTRVDLAIKLGDAPEWHRPIGRDVYGASSRPGAAKFFSIESNDRPDLLAMLTKAHTLTVSIQTEAGIALIKQRYELPRSGEWLEMYDRALASAIADAHSEHSCPPPPLPVMPRSVTSP